MLCCSPSIYTVLYELVWDVRRHYAAGILRARYNARGRRPELSGQGWDRSEPCFRKKSMMQYHRGSPIYTVPYSVPLPSIQFNPRPVRPPIQSTRRPPIWSTRRPPGITVPYSILHSAQGFHSAQPVPCPPAHLIHPPPARYIPFPIRSSTLHIYMSKPPHYSCFSGVWGGWPEVNRKRCFWKTLLLHHTFYNISKNYYIISDITIVKTCFHVISVVKHSPKIAV